MSVTNLTNDALKAMLISDHDLQVVDVRTPDEWHYLGHIPQARLISLHELLARQGELDKNAKTVFICEHGVRSADASHYFAQQLGYTQVYNLTHGMAEWDGERVIPATASEQT